MPSKLDGAPVVQTIIGNGTYIFNQKNFRPGGIVAINPTAGLTHGGFTAALAVSPDGVNFFSKLARRSDGAAAEASHALSSGGGVLWDFDTPGVLAVQITVTNWVSGSADLAYMPVDTPTAPVIQATRATT